MYYTGEIIEESLADMAILKRMDIIGTRVEPVTPEHKTPWLTQWTLHTIRVPEEDVAETVLDLSQALEKNHTSWYIDFKNRTTHYIIFPNRVFKVKRSQPEQYEDVVDYGLKQGIPRYQLSFSPDIKPRAGSTDV